MQRITALFVPVAIALPALAGVMPHAGDIGVSIHQSRIVTSLVSKGDGPRGDLGTPERVFSSDLGTIEFGPFGNDEPGYTSDVLPAGFRIGLNILSPLGRWNGSSFVAPIAESLQIARFLGTPAEEAIVTADGFVPGYLFAQADDAGFIDEHLSHVLRGPGVARGFEDPADGIYLIELELFSDSPGIGNSQPFWIVFNLNSDESAHDAAIGYVRDVLVPAPGIASLAFGALVLQAGRVRRRAGEQG